MTQPKPTHEMIGGGRPWHAGTDLTWCRKCNWADDLAYTHFHCPRCCPQLWREIVAEAAPVASAPEPSLGGMYKAIEMAKIPSEPQCVWWWKYRDQSWKELMRTLFSDYDTPEKRSRAEDVLWHYGPRPPCEDGKHVTHWREPGIKGHGRVAYPKCPDCHASLDVGASDKTMQESSNKDLPAKDARTSPKPLHQDPLRFRGHLRGCHAWRWESYDRCSCARFFEQDLGFGTVEHFSLHKKTGKINASFKETTTMEAPFTDRIGDYDL